MVVSVMLCPCIFLCCSVNVSVCLICGVLAVLLLNGCV